MAEAALVRFGPRWAKVVSQDEASLEAFLRGGGWLGSKIHEVYGFGLGLRV